MTVPPLTNPRTISTRMSQEVIETVEIHDGRTRDAIILVREALATMKAHGQSSIAIRHQTDGHTVTIEARA